MFDGDRWPPCSPDMNPIEHVWAMVSRELVGQVFANRDRLWDAVQAAFQKITPAQINNLCDSMPRRIASLLAAKGWYTRY